MVVPSNRFPAARAAAFGLALALGASGCGDSAPADERPVVVATTAMIGDVAAELARGHVRVATLMASGVDPHLYRATRDDVREMMDAQLVLYSGLHLEGRMADTLAGLASESRAVLAVAESLKGEVDARFALLSDPSVAEAAAEAAHDPHVWMDPLRWCRASEAIARELARLVPEHAEEMLGPSLSAWKRRCEALTAFGEACFATIPEGQRVIVTAHDAFRYMGERFGLEVVGLQGISTESEAGVRRIEELVELVVSRRVPAVFVESSVPDRAVKALVEGARARGLDVSIGGELYSDAMGAPGTRAGTYVGMIEHNIVTITRALGGRVPGGSFELWRAVAQGVDLEPRVDSISLRGPDGAVSTEAGHR